MFDSILRLFIKSLLFSRMSPITVSFIFGNSFFAIAIAFNIFSKFFIGTSALTIVTKWFLNSFWLFCSGVAISTPFHMTLILLSEQSKNFKMSLFDDSDGDTIAFIFFTFFFWKFKKEYQRLIENLRKKPGSFSRSISLSTWIGWCKVVTSLLLIIFE